MKLRTAVLVIALVQAPVSQAFERDVHFGLTKWLALKAGYSENQADAIATGDQRVDRGGMQFMEYMAAYACAGQDAEGSSNVQGHDFPSAGSMPRSPQQRVVVAGSTEAWAASRQAMSVPRDKAGFMLYKLGEAIHSLQDSWSHQGVPETPALFGIACNSGLAWGHPASRGGWNSHRADVTWRWKSDTLAMAEASYSVLKGYPTIGGATRNAVDWDRLKPLVADFAAATMKSEKAKWFGTQHIDDTSFLAGTSIPDGTAPFTTEWEGDKLPPLTSMQSRQNSIDPALTAFLSRFFTDWVTSTDFAAMGAKYARPGSSPAAKGRPGAMSASELGGRMQAWRIRDHGSIAEITHSPLPLTAKQFSALKKIAHGRDAYARYANAMEAYVPILPKTMEATPIVPYLVSTLPGDALFSGPIATVRFKHAPYDSVSVAIGRVGVRWVVLSIAPIVEH